MSWSQPYEGIARTDRTQDNLPHPEERAVVSEKLIRDLIPKVAACKGDPIIVRTARPSEMPELLRLKLLEEFREVMDASTDELLGELADLVEVAHALAVAHGHGPTALDVARVVKRNERGGFSKRLVMKLPKA